MSHKMLLSDYKERLKAKFNGRITVDGTLFNGRKVQCNHTCKGCKTTWLTTPDSLLGNQGFGCYPCAMKSRVEDIASFQADIQSTYPSVSCREFVSRTRPASFECNSCGHTWKNKMARFVFNQGCPKCNAATKVGPRRNAAILARMKKLKALGKLKFKVLSEITDLTGPIELQCLSCNHTWSTAMTNLRKTGCSHCKFDNHYRAKPYSIGKRVVNVQGYEAWALDYLKATGVNMASIAVKAKEGKPLFQYKEKGKTRTYVPDLYNTKSKTVIEVKGTYTLGLTSSLIYDNVVRKAKAVIAQGYKFRMMVFREDGTLIKMPSNWYDMPRTKLAKAIRI